MLEMFVAYPDHLLVDAQYWHPDMRERSKHDELLQGAAGGLKGHGRLVSYER